MPSVATEPSHDGVRASACRGTSLPSSKKRRWEDGRSSDSVISFILPEDADERRGHRLAAATTAVAGSSLLRSPPSPSQRKMIVPGSKRLRFSSCDSSNSEDGGCRSRPAKDSAAPPPSLADAHTPSPMLSCHVCRRKPRRKSDLDSQADCEGCGQRTCFVCLRECPGWSDCDNDGQTPTDETRGDGTRRSGVAAAQQNGRKAASPRPWSASSRGHRRIVCSRCCVERGQDGDVVCLGCMAS